MLRGRIKFMGGKLPRIVGGLEAKSGGGKRRWNVLLSFVSICVSSWRVCGGERRRGIPCGLGS